MKINLLACLILLFPSLLFAQEMITGRVMDATNNKPLPGALVITGTDTTVTSAAGIFSIRTAGFPVQIHIQFLGYSESRSLIKTGSDHIRIALEPSTLALNEVLITSGVQEKRIRNTAGSVDLISKSMLQRDDPFTITHSLNRIPGLYMHTGTFNTNRITIRGVGSRSPYGTTKIKAYYDQIPLTDGSGNSSLEDIDQALIERIEIVKGPNSSLYGAGLAGVVKLHSYQPESNQTSLESSLTLGSYATRRWMNRFAQSDENKSISLVYSKMQSDGYRQNSTYDRDQIGISSRFYVDNNSYVSFLGVYTSLKAYIPSSINADDFKNTPEKADFNWGTAQGFEQYDKGLFGLSYVSAFAPRWELASSVFFKFRDAYEPRPFDILDENTTSVGTRNALSYRLQSLSLSVGTEIFRDTYTWSLYENLYDNTTNGSVLGPVFSIYNETRSYTNFFTEASYQPVKGLTIVAGVNLNHTRYTLEDKYAADSLDKSGEYAFDQMLSPRIGISYEAGPATGLFLNVSHGFSPPGLEETLLPDGQINTDIQPETGWNFEAGVRGNLKRLNYDAALYLMRIQDLLVAERIGDDQYLGVNAGLNTHMGFDLYTSYFLPVTANYTLNFFNSFSWMNYAFTQFTHREMEYNGNQLPGVPQVTLNPGLELISESGFYGNLTGRYTGQIPIDDANSIFSDEYFLLNAKVGYRLRLTHWQVDLNAGASNLLNEHYASMLLINAVGFGGNQPRYFYPGLPRNYFGSLAVKYIF